MNFSDPRQARRLSSLYSGPAAPLPPMAAAPPTPGNVAIPAPVTREALSSIYAGGGMAAPPARVPAQPVAAPPGGATAPARSPGDGSLLPPGTVLVPGGATRLPPGVVQGAPWANPSGIGLPGSGMTPAQAAAISAQRRKAAMDAAFSGQQRSVSMPMGAEQMPALVQTGGVR